MSSHRILRALFATTALCGSGIVAAPALAQQAPPAPVRQSIDGNGVDLFLGTFNIAGPQLSMGADTLTYHLVNRGQGWSDTATAQLVIDGDTVTVEADGRSDRFVAGDDGYVSTENDGATLYHVDAPIGNLHTFIYTRPDGTNFYYLKNNTTGVYHLTTAVFPTGEEWFFTSASATYCDAFDGAHNCTTQHGVYRVATIESQFGYTFNLAYQSDDAPSVENPSAWFTVTGVTGKNLAVPAFAGASQTMSTETVGGADYYDVTDAAGRETKFRMTGDAVAGITRPGSTSEDVTVAYSASKVSSVTTPVGATSYSYADASGVRTTTVTDPLGHATVYTFDIASQRMKSATDALSHEWSWLYDANEQVTDAIQPEGNKTHVTYDARGNITEVRQVSKTPGTPADIVTTASYPTSCTSPASCNKPDWTKDAKGNQTDYTYDATSGQLLTVTAPAPTTGATRPKTTYSYTTYQAYYSNGTSIVASGGFISRLTGISQCQTSASCAGTADEVKTTISYGPQTNGVGNNLLPVSMSTSAGDGSLTATTATGYDPVGNAITVDGPLSGTGDTTTYRYDADRALVGVIAPDPDGAGTRKRAASRVTYDDKGRPTLVEDGVVNGTTDAAWAAFAPAQAIATSYDGADRPLTRTLQSGATPYALTQYSYDHQRLDCVATRMNIAVYASLPSSACTATTAGANGPDQIVKAASYDDVDRVLKTISAYGTAAASADATATYNANGTNATLTDAANNMTSYSYDGFDRLIQTAYPMKTAGSGTSSTTDYEQLGYDANGNVTSHRLRDARSIAYTYDNLNRMTLKNLPSGELDVTYGYDLLGRLTSAATTAQTLTFGYDALSRITTQGGPLGTMTSAYDAAGERTQLTWPDAFYVGYDYDSAGNLLHIRENGAASGIGVLATFGYDDLGRRTSLTRGNGTITGYTPDAVSRLSSLSHDLNGTASDLTLGFGYTPAGQIASTTRSNTAYSAAFANKAQAYIVNGLNALLKAGADTIAPDTRGNTVKIGTNTYTYSSENLLLTGPNAAALTYDPVMRLYQTSATGFAATRFQYDGLDMAGEYDASGVLQKRYVLGGNGDDPLVEYDRGTGGTYTRAWLHADERSSVIGRSDDSGAGTAVNTYDEYGVPGAGNTGRFQYTGQAWLPELGFYYYKARMYAPALGRFLQTDPIGYGDGMNWYGYVGGDPVNSVDPSGLQDSGGGDVVIHAPYSCNDCGVPGIDMFHSNGLGTTPGFAITDQPPSILDVVVNGVRNKKPKPIYGAAVQRIDLSPPEGSDRQCSPLPRFGVPDGFQPYDSRGRLMTKIGDKTGRIYTNPAYADFIRNSHIDWTGFATSMAIIVAGSVAGGLGLVAAGGEMGATTSQLVGAGASQAGVAGSANDAAKSVEKHPEDSRCSN